MSPGDEQAAEARLGERFVSARDVDRQVHDEARRLYVDLIARIGATPVDGKTLRQALKAPDGYSRWWFHKISEKDCGWDDDPTYLTIIRLLCVRHIMDAHQIARTRVFGGTPEFVTVVGGPSPGLWRTSYLCAKALAYGVLSRMVFLQFYIRLWWILRRLPCPGDQAWDVALEAHWDWSLRLDRDGTPSDRYFRDLPGRLEAEGIKLGWLAWCEPRTESWQRGRRLREVASATLAEPRVVLLERYLGLWDILSAGLRVRYLLEFTRYTASPAFRCIFQIVGFDLFSVMRAGLLRGFADSCIPRRELVLQATTRAVRHLHPKILLTFLELFLHTRAMYAGARRGVPGIKVWTAQHGAYCSDKTIGMFEPRLEFYGEPDGCGVEPPDRFFAMGELARRIWRGSGLAPDRVGVLGGLRYQDVRLLQSSGCTAHGRVTVLLVCAMNAAWDLDMCEAAVLAATEVPQIRLRFRDHPQYRLSEHPRFARYRQAIEITTGSLDEDLVEADLLLFTYSGVAEEALLRGVPVWHWGWAGFNPSVFGDLPVIPTFTSVRGLRDALQSFVRDQEPFRPTSEVQETVLRACFGPAPARASARIAEDITAYIRGSEVLTSGSAKAREQ